MLLNQARENLAVIRRQVSDSSVVLIYMCILWMLIVSRIAYSNIQLGNALWIVKQQLINIQKKLSQTQGFSEYKNISLPDDGPTDAFVASKLNEINSIKKNVKSNLSAGLTQIHLLQSIQPTTGYKKKENTCAFSCRH